MSVSAPQKFTFDTEFSSAGLVTPGAPRPKRLVPAEEVEQALQAQAFAEGQAAQRVSDEGRRAQALADIADACRQALPMLNQVIEAHRAQAASLALATGEAVASAALDRLPRAPLNAALEALSAEIDGAARLIVRASGADGDLAAMLEKAANDAGLPGRVLLRDEPGLGPAAFVIEWPDGRAEYDPDAAAQRVRDALQAALAAEADHPSGEF